MEQLNQEVQKIREKILLEIAVDKYLFTTIKELKTLDINEMRFEAIYKIEEYKEIKSLKELNELIHELQKIQVLWKYLEEDGNNEGTITED